MTTLTVMRPALKSDDAGRDRSGLFCETATLYLQHNGHGVSCKHFNRSATPFSPGWSPPRCYGFMPAIFQSSETRATEELNMRSHTKLVVLLLALTGTTGAMAQVDYEKAPAGTRILGLTNGTEIRMLLEQANLGSGEIEIGEITLPAGTGMDVPIDRGHKHGVIEIFYVLEGELEHVVNGTPYLLKPGMLGVVRPEDSVGHRVPGQRPMKALIIWAPGGEADRLVSGGFSERPLE
jgi:quercetin dioxygenase-like cupin family protein